MNKIVFRDEVLSMQRLKYSFVYLFWSKTKVFILNGLMNFAHFWIGRALSGSFERFVHVS